MTKGFLSPKVVERKTSRIRRHSSDYSPRAVGSSRVRTVNSRGRLLLIRKSKLRLYSLPVAEDDMYFSEPELPTNDFDKPSKSSPRFNFQRSSSISSEPPQSTLMAKAAEDEKQLTQPEQSSALSSEDDDGILFRTLTSQSAHVIPSISGSPRGLKVDLDTSSLTFQSVVASELEGVPPISQEQFLPPSFLDEYMRLPFVVEYVVNHGIISCLSSLLYELTFMPISASKGIWKRFLSNNRSSMSFVEQSDLVRCLILFMAVVIMNASIDFSAVYHYIRAQSLLKLYFIFNMMEIIERLVRSWGNDLVDGLVRCMVTRTGHSAFFGTLGHSIVVLVYTLLHAYIHFWRVMIISVAVLANDMLIVLVTNNFNELKGTVFKKIEPRSLYPVITSDVVERLYLFIDVSLMLFRMATSPQRSKMPFGEVSYWIAVMIGLEIITDWLKFLCISKFNQIDNSAFWQYCRIHKEDILNSRNEEARPIPPLVQKGFVSPSHLPARRMNFMPTPLAVLIICNLMLPNLVGADPLSLWTFRILVISALFLVKLGVDWFLIGDAMHSDRSTPIMEKLQNVRSL